MSACRMVIRKLQTSIDNRKKIIRHYDTIFIYKKQM